MSAWEDLKGAFDFNRTPMAPLGCPVIVYEDSKTRPKLAKHGEDGFYVGPSFDQYRSYTVFVPKTGRLRQSDTIAWLPYSY
jgi:hypothetical protein